MNNDKQNVAGEKGGRMTTATQTHRLEENRERGGHSLQRFVRGHNHVTLYNADCLEIAPTLTGVDAVITDPPYGISYDTQYLTSKSGKLNGGCPKNRRYPKIEGDEKPFDPAPWTKYNKVAMWGGNHYAKRLPDGGRWLVWDKRLDNRMRFDQGDGEVAWTNASGIALRIYRFWWTGGLMQGEANGKPRLHPTQKPIELMAWTIKEAGVLGGETVLDPYMGSGTTGIAAIRLGMNFVGIEKNAEYFNAACDRIQTECNQSVML